MLRVGIVIWLTVAVLAFGLALWAGWLDAGCTGFQWAELIWPGIRTCCIDHDLGGSDGALLDCLLTFLPGWTGPLAAIGVALMLVARPIYEHMRGFSARR